MIIDNSLEVGKFYKNLKVICEILNLQYKDSTDSRKAILKEIKCHYKLEKKGRGYIVLEKYNTPKEKEDKRKYTKGNNSGKGKYDLLMDHLIIDWLSKTEDTIVTFTGLFLENKEIINIPLLSNDYSDLLNKGHESFAKEINIKKDLVDMYREKLYMIISKCLETSLNRLQRQKIIDWQKDIMVKYYSSELLIAEEDIVANIKQAEKEVYEETEITSFQRRNPIINKNFKTKVCNKLQVSSYWNVYNIEVINSDKIIKIDNADEIKKELTLRFVDSIMKSLEKKEI